MFMKGNLLRMIVTCLLMGVKVLFLNTVTWFPPDQPLSLGISSDAYFQYSGISCLRLVQPCKDY